MSIGKPLPEELCPENEYEAWYHAINSLVNFVTSMSQLAACYSGQLQNLHNRIEYVSEDEETAMGAKDIQNAQTQKPFQIKKEMPLVKLPTESFHGESNKEPRTFSLIDTADFGDVKDVNHHYEIINAKNLTKGDTNNLNTSNSEVLDQNGALTINDTNIIDVSIEPNKRLSNIVAGGISSQIPQTISNETYFTEYSDSDQTINSLNLQENYEGLEKPDKFIQNKNCAIESVGQIFNNDNEDSLKGTVSSKMIYEKISEEVEQFSVDLETKNSMDKMDSKNFIEQTCNDLKVLEKEIQNLCKNEDKPNDNKKCLEVNLAVPDFAANPTPKKIVKKTIIRQTSSYATNSKSLLKEKLSDKYVKKAEDLKAPTESGSNLSNEKLCEKDVKKSKDLKVANNSGPKIVNNKKGLEKRMVAKNRAPWKPVLKPQNVALINTSNNTKETNAENNKLTKEDTDRVESDVRKIPETFKRICPRHGANHTCPKRTSLAKIEEGSSDTTRNRSTKNIPYTSIPVRLRTLKAQSFSAEKLNADQKSKIIADKSLSESQTQKTLNSKYLNTYNFRRVPEKRPLLTNATIKLNEKQPKAEENSLFTRQFKSVEPQFTKKVSLINKVTNQLVEKQKEANIKGKNNLKDDKILLKVDAAENLRKADQLLKEGAKLVLKKM